MRLIIFILLLSNTLLATSDRGKVARQYMSSFSDIAVAEMHRTGIPASIKLAQGMLESNWGQSDLATKANNHFGIKCGGNWSGNGYYKEDDDRNSKGELIKSCFREFTDAQESYIAHSEFLMDSKKTHRYGFLFDYGSMDYRAWAHGLKKSGYATDPKYPQKLISIIEKYNLSKYDRKNSSLSNHTRSTKEGTEASHTTTATAESSTTTRDNTRTSTKPSTNSTRTVITSKLQYDINANNKVRLVYAMGGETVAQLARKVGVSLEDILLYNEVYLQKEDILEAGDRVYIEKKKRKLYIGPKLHIVKEGETMESISQIYGIRLKSLYAKNRMPKTAQTVAGQKLYLQETASLSERPRFTLLNSKRNHSFLFEDDPTVK